MNDSNLRPINLGAYIAIVRDGEPLVMFRSLIEAADYVRKSNVHDVALVDLYDGSVYANPASGGNLAPITKLLPEVLAAFRGDR